MFSDLTLSTLSNRKRGYKNMTRHRFRKNRAILKVELEGNCCWKIFSDIFFSGESQNLGEGFNGNPDFPIKSAKSKTCR